MDSEEKDKDQPQPQPTLPAGVTSLMVRNADGVTVSERLKDEKGRFVKKPKPLIPTVEYVRSRRKRLAQVRKDNNLTEDLSILNELLEIINTPCAIDKKSGTPDAKWAMAKIKAAEVVWLFTMGKPAPSEQELDRLKTQDVKVIMVSAPQLMHPEVHVEKPKQLEEKPSFIDAEVIQTNPKKV